jgi:APA family basic amino acid/polyamine antiporter
MMAAIIGLCYAELASMFPRAGADYEYTRQAMGGRPAFVVGWLMVISNIIAASAVALGFGGYLHVLAGVEPVPAAICALVVASLVSFYGVEQAVWASAIGTAVELAGLVLIIAVGVPHFGTVDLLDFERGPGGVLAGASLVMFAFLGFSQIATLAEEAEDATRVIPRAMLLSIGICTTLYVLVSIAAVSVLDWRELGSSSAPLADVASAELGARAADGLAVIALFSTANTMLLLMVAASRLIFGMARAEALPRFLAWIDPERRTPARAILLALLLAAAFALTGNLTFVAGATNFAVFVGFGAACLSLMVLRLRKPGLERPFRVPLVIRGLPVLPLLGIGLAALLMANLGRDSLLVGLGLFLAGVLAMQVLALWRPYGQGPARDG